MRWRQRLRQPGRARYVRGHIGQVVARDHARHVDEQRELRQLVGAQADRLAREHRCHAALPRRQVSLLGRLLFAHLLAVLGIGGVLAQPLLPLVIVIAGSNGIGRRVGHPDQRSRRAEARRVRQRSADHHGDGLVRVGEERDAEIAYLARAAGQVVVGEDEALGVVNGRVGLDAPRARILVEQVAKERVFGSVQISQGLAQAQRQHVVRGLGAGRSARIGLGHQRLQFGRQRVEQFDGVEATQEQPRVVRLLDHRRLPDHVLHCGHVLVRPVEADTGDVRHDGVAHGVVHVAGRVQGRLALLPHAHALAVHAPGGRVGFFDLRQVRQRLARHVAACQLAVAVHAGALDVRARHQHPILFLGLEARALRRVGGHAGEHAAQGQIALRLHVAHDEAEIGVADLAARVALLARPVPPHLNLLGLALDVARVADLPAQGQKVGQLGHVNRLGQAAHLQVVAAYALHHRRAARHPAHRIGPGVAGLLAQLGAVEARQVLAVPARGGGLAEHVQVHQLAALRGEDGAHQRGHLDRMRRRRHTGGQLLLDDVADHVALALAEGGTHLARDRRGSLLRTLHLQLHRAHLVGQLLAHRLEAKAGQQRAGFLAQLGDQPSAGGELQAIQRVEPGPERGGGFSLAGKPGLARRGRRWRGGRRCAAGDVLQDARVGAIEGAAVADGAFDLLGAPRHPHVLIAELGAAVLRAGVVDDVDAVDVSLVHPGVQGSHALGVRAAIEGLP